MTPLSRRVEVEVAQSFSGGGLPATSTLAKTDPADLRLPTSGLACAVETRQALRRADVQIPAVAELQSIDVESGLDGRLDHLTDVHFPAG